MKSGQMLETKIICGTHNTKYDDWCPGQQYQNLDNTKYDDWCPGQQYQNLEIVKWQNMVFIQNIAMLIEGVISWLTNIIDRIKKSNIPVLET